MLWCPIRQAETLTKIDIKAFHKLEPGAQRIWKNKRISQRVKASTAATPILYQAKSRQKDSVGIREIL